MLLEKLASAISFKTFGGTLVDDNPLHIGLFQKKSKQGGLRMYFSEKPHRIFRFPCYPWPMEIPNEFLLNTPGNPTSFLIDPWNFDMLFLQYPWIFHVLNHPEPPCLDFFWNSPFIDLVFKCFAYSWFVQNSQGTVHVISASWNAVDDLILKKKLWSLFMDGVQLAQGLCHFKETVYFLPLSSQKFLVLILSTLEG